MSTSNTVVVRDSFILPFAFMSHGRPDQFPGIHSTALIKEHHLTSRTVQGTCQLTFSAVVPRNIAHTFE